MTLPSRAHWALAVSLACVSAHAGTQITPNPNPVGNTISVTTGTDDSNLTGTVFDNNGEITIDSVIFRNEAGATLDNNSTGEIFVGPTSGFPGGIYKNDGILNNDGDVTMRGGGGLDNHLSTSVINNSATGVITISNLNLLGFEGALDNRNTINNDGLIIVEATLLNATPTGATTGTITGSGTFTVDTTGSGLPKPGAIIGTEFSAGILHQDQVNVFAGTLDIGESGTVTGGDFYADGGVTVVNGSIDMDTVEFTGGAMVIGTGSIETAIDPLSVDIDAIIAPGEALDGESIGTLEIFSDFNLEGTYEATVGAVGDNDLIDATGFGQTIDLAPVSFLEILMLEEPDPFDFWDLIEADTITGSFGDIEIYLDFVGDCDPEIEECQLITVDDFQFDVSIIQDAFGSTDVLRLTALAPVPVPAAAWLFGSALGVLGWVRRRRENGVEPSFRASKTRFDPIALGSAPTPVPTGGYGSPSGSQRAPDTLPAARSGGLRFTDLTRSRT